MRIALVYDAVYPYVIGGAEKRIRDVAQGLAKAHDVHVVGLQWWKGSRTFREASVTYHGIAPAMGLYTHKGRRRIGEPFYFSAFLFCALWRIRPDVVDCQNFPYLPCLAAKMYCKVTRTPLMITWLEVWGARWTQMPFGVLGRWIERLTMRLTPFNLALSAHTAARLPHPTVIPPPLNLPRIKQAKASKDKVDVLFAGRLIKEKHVDLLLQALHGTQLTAKVIGTGPERKRLERYAHLLGLDSSVTFTGVLTEDEVYAAMKSAGCVVLPSEREGFGLVVLEAVACGSNAYTLRFRDNAASTLLPPTHIIDPTAAALRQALLSSRKRPQLPLERYEIENVVAQLERYYARCRKQSCS